LWRQGYQKKDLPLSSSREGRREEDQGAETKGGAIRSCCRTTISGLAQEEKREEISAKGTGQKKRIQKLLGSS